VYFVVIDDSICSKSLSSFSSPTLFFHSFRNHSDIFSLLSIALVSVQIDDDYVSIGVWGVSMTKRKIGTVNSDQHRCFPAFFSVVRSEGNHPPSDAIFLPTPYFLCMRKVGGVSSLFGLLMTTKRKFTTVASENDRGLFFFMKLTTQIHNWFFSLLLHIF